MPQCHGSGLSAGASAGLLPRQVTEPAGQEIVIVNSLVSLALAYDGSA